MLWWTFMSFCYYSIWIPTPTLKWSRIVNCRGNGQWTARRILYICTLHKKKSQAVWTSTIGFKNVSQQRKRACKAVTLIFLKTREWIPNTFKYSYWGGPSITFLYFARSRTRKSYTNNTQKKYELRHKNHGYARASTPNNDRWDFMEEHLTHRERT